MRLGHEKLSNADEDAVGGEMLDLALGQAQLRGRIVKCGGTLAGVSRMQTVDSPYASH